MNEVWSDGYFETGDGPRRAKGQARKGTGEVFGARVSIRCLARHWESGGVRRNRQQQEFMRNRIGVVTGRLHCQSAWSG